MKIRSHEAALRGYWRPAVKTCIRGCDSHTIILVRWIINGSVYKHSWLIPTKSTNSKSLTMKTSVRKNPTRIRLIHTFYTDYTWCVGARPDTFKWQNKHQEGHNIFGGKVFIILTLLANWLQEKPSATSLLSTRVMECVTRDVLLWHVTWQSNLASNPVNCQWFIHPKIPSQGEGLGVIWWWFSFGESCCLSDHRKVARSKSMTMFVRDGAIVFVNALLWRAPGM